MSRIEVELAETLVPGTIDTKRICTRPTGISVTASDPRRLVIDFGEVRGNGIKLSAQYINEVAAFLRSYVVLTGKVARLNTITGSDIEVGPDAVEAIRYQSLLFDNGRIEDAPLQLDLNPYFGTLRSSTRQYRYLNNSIPWLVLYYQACNMVERCRHLFTVVDMIGTYATNPGANMESRFTAVYQHGLANGVPYQPVFDRMMAIWNDPNHQNNSHGFTAAARLVDGVLNDARLTTDPQRVIRFFYELRNKYFHGNMSPVFSYSGVSRRLVEDSVAVTSVCVRKVLETLCSDVIEIQHEL